MEIDISLNQEKSIFRILKESFVLYLKNFIPLSLIMVFPIVAHLIGIPYIIYVGNNFNTLFPMEITADNALYIVALTIVATIPGFVLFLVGFWKFLQSMAAINRFAVSIINNESSIKYSSCAEYIKYRKKDYVIILSIFTGMWLFPILLPVVVYYSLFFLPSIIPLFLSILLFAVLMIFLTLVSVYLSLSFQVFAFEEISPISVLKRSAGLIVGNFFRTVLLIIILFLITSLIMPFLIHSILELLGIVNILANVFRGLANSIIFSFQTLSIYFPDSPVSFLMMFIKFDSELELSVSKMIVLNAIDLTVTTGMLPLGTIAFALLYYDIIFRKGIISKNNV